MRPLLCETVTGHSMATVIAARDASRGADMVELRLDGVTDLDVAGALHGRRSPVIVTCRPVWEGGRFDGPEEVRRAILERALELGAEYVDIEWRAGFAALVHRSPDRVVLSSHDFNGVPRDLPAQAREMRSVGAGMIKIAVMPKRLSELLPLRGIAAQDAAVVIGMGPTGVASRVLAAQFGSQWSYAGDGVAPGQLSAARMLGEFRFRDVHSDTAIYGLVGNNVSHSLSPAMHNAAFAATATDAVYVPLLPADFDDFLEFAAAIGLQGASVTIPYKVDALKVAKETDERARSIGAANTLKRIPNGFAATNTDIDGFLLPLEELYAGALVNVRAAVLGAGGAARAAVVGLRSRGAKVSVHARREGQARELAAGLDVSVGSWPIKAGSWDLLVNCTPAGSSAAPDESPVAAELLTGSAVYDLTYRPRHEGVSPLLDAARRAGCRTLDGLPMLIAQAEQQFAWWTGKKPPDGVMSAAVGRQTSRADAARPGNQTRL